MEALKKLAEDAAEHMPCAVCGKTGVFDEGAVSVIEPGLGAEKFGNSRFMHKKCALDLMACSFALCILKDEMGDFDKVQEQLWEVLTKHGKKGAAKKKEGPATV